MKKMYKNLNIRIDEKTEKALKYLTEDRFNDIEFPFPYKINKSEFIRSLILIEYSYQLQFDNGVKNDPNYNLIG